MFVCLTNAKKQLIKYESVLHLDKKYAMDEKQILSEKSERQMKHLKAEFTEKLETVSTENQKLRMEINELKKQMSPLMSLPYMLTKLQQPYSNKF